MNDEQLENLLRAAVHFGEQNQLEAFKRSSVKTAWKNLVGVYAKVKGITRAEADDQLNRILFSSIFATGGG